MLNPENDTGSSSLLPDLPRIPFYIGTIKRVNHKKGSGAILTGSGREIPFLRPFVDMLNGRKLEELSQGLEVGFDVGWTSRGLRITKIKIF